MGVRISSGSWRRPVFYSALVVAVAGTVGAVMLSADAAVTSRTYFVDCAAGNDANNGTDQRHPWKTLAKAGGTTLNPGDHLRLRAGVTCAGTLQPTGSGTAANPVVINSYGNGANARIDGGGAIAAILLSNVQGYELHHLEVTNTGATPAAAGQQRNGVYVRLTDFGVGRHFVVDDVAVHDVNGCDCRIPNPSGGIVFEAAGAATPTGFDDINVHDSSVANVDRTGIGTFSSWQRRAEYPNGPGTTFVPMTQVRIHDNHVSNVGGDGIVVLNGVDARVQRNVVDGYNLRSAEPNVGAYAWNSDRSIFQYNDVAHGAGIGMAFAWEGANVGTIYQYNFSHDNSGGFLYACAQQGETTSKNNIARYNISQNDVASSPYLGLFTFNCADEPGTQVYNNTFYAPNSPRIVNNFGQMAVTFTNNIFVGQAAGSVVNDPHGTYRNNVAYQVTLPSTLATNTIAGDPKFTAPGTAVALGSAQGYYLATGSPALAAGIPVAASGNSDYYGNGVPSGAPSIGAYQGPVVVS